MINYTDIAEQVTRLSGVFTTPQQLHSWDTRGTVNLDGVPFPGLDNAADIAKWARAGTRPGPRSRE